MRKNGHMDDCTFVKGQGWACAEGCPKAEDPKNHQTTQAEAPPAKSADWRKDYANHPKFAKFQKGRT